VTRACGCVEGAVHRPRCPDWHTLTPVERLGLCEPAPRRRRRADGPDERLAFLFGVLVGVLAALLLAALAVI
jgi:hypothetical protein